MAEQRNNTARKQKKTNSKSITPRSRKRHKSWPQTANVVRLDDDNVKEVVCYEVIRRKGGIKLVQIP